mgnify:CR=1 FL=1
MSDDEPRFCDVCGVLKDSEGRCTSRCPDDPHHDPEGPSDPFAEVDE